MTVIKATTKRGQNLLASTEVSKGYTLDEVYSSYSHDKAVAYQQCRRWCDEENGRNFRITSANSWQFTVAWDVDGGRRIETASNSYLVKEA